MASVTFVSKGRNFGATIETAGIPMTDKTGTVVSWSKGKHVKFDNGVLVTDDQQVIDTLRTRPTFGVEFWELGQEPGVILPKTQDLLDQITVAAMRNKPERIREILAAERDSHRREEVIRTGELALGELTEGREGRLSPGRRPQTRAA